MNLTRRVFLSMGLASVFLSACMRRLGNVLAPFAVSDRTVNPERVVRVYNNKLNTWDFTTGIWTDYNDFDEFYKTTIFGLKKLTNTATVQEAWESILTGYQPGHKITIKLNHNNISVGNDPARPNTSLAMAAAVVKSLVEDLGVQQSNITVYDVVRNTGTWWRTPWATMFPGVAFVRQATVVWDTSNPVHFPNGADLYLPMNLVNADHLLNLSLLKGHGGYATGAMKNHFGTVNRPTSLHTDRQRQIAYLNWIPQIKDKERLCICEAHMLGYPGQADYYAPAQFTELYPSGKFGSLLLSKSSFYLDNVMADVVDFEALEEGDGYLDNTFLDIAENEYGLGYRDVPALVSGKFSVYDLSYTSLDYSSFDVNERVKLPDEPNISVGHEEL